MSLTPELEALVNEKVRGAGRAAAHDVTTGGGGSSGPLLRQVDSPAFHHEPHVPERADVARRDRRRRR